MYQTYPLFLSLHQTHLEEGVLQPYGFFFRVEVAESPSEWSFFFIMLSKLNTVLKLDADAYGGFTLTQCYDLLHA